METLLSKMQKILAFIFLWSCSTAVRGSSPDAIVLFGDSLSDNGNGYAGNAKFILRTNQVMTLSGICSPILYAKGEFRATAIVLNEDGNVRSSESDMRFNADISRKPLLSGKMEQWPNLDRGCGVVIRGQPDRLWCWRRHNGKCTCTYVSGRIQVFVGGLFLHSLPA